MCCDIFFTDINTMDGSNFFWTSSIENEHYSVSYDRRCYLDDDHICGNSRHVLRNLVVCVVDSTMFNYPNGN